MRGAIPLLPLFAIMAWTVNHSPPSTAEVKNERSYTSIPLFAFMAWTVNHSPPSIAKVKNERSYTSTPPICHHGVDS
jgi:hypothetical protein